jgi:hypothetical protein
MSQHNHIGLLTTAKSFYKSAEKLNTGPQHLDAPLPVYYLFLHSVELALKSYLYFRGVDEDGLREIGHDLEGAWQKAKDLGICDLCSECQQLQECIRIIGPIYRGSQLEYFYPGRTRLPIIANIHECSGKILTVLDDFYGRQLKTERDLQTA